MACSPVMIGFGGSVQLGLLRKHMEPAPEIEFDVGRSWFRSEGVSCRFSGTSTGLAFGRERSTFDVDWIVVGGGRIDNRRELEELLVCSKREKPVEDCELVWMAYRKWGDLFAHRILGDFAFCIVDHLENQVLLVRDVVGAKSLFYSIDGETLLFGSSFEELVGQRRGTFELDPRWLAASSTRCYGPKSLELTACVGVAQVPPASIVRFSDGRVHKSRYWQLEPGEDSSLSDSDCLEGFRERFLSSVKLRLGRADRTGFELSAGLDSSSIVAAAIACGFSPKQVHSYSHVLSERSSERAGDYGREFELVESNVRHFGIPSPCQIHQDGGGFIDFLSASSSGMGGGLWNQWGVYSRALYEKAGAAGIHCLLSGAGGDDLVSTANALIYRDWFRSGDWIRFARELMLDSRLTSTRQRLARLASSLMPLSSFKRRSRSNYLLGGNQFLSDSILSKDIVTELLEESSSYYASLDFSGKRIFGVSEGFLASGRLPGSCEVASRFGIEVRYPMLDRTLMEFCMKLPLRLLRRDGFGRYPLRKAMPELPSRIRWGELKQVPAIPWVADYFRSSGREVRNYVRDLEKSGIDLSWLNLTEFREAALGLEDLDPVGRYRFMQSLGISVMLRRYARA
ncbi:asparagine synthase-related protein [Pelagicoccus enzymogenes]|nr:asparagine synthase-related protein [Pelagicoccus enzymogenes]